MAETETTSELTIQLDKDSSRRNSEKDINTGEKGVTCSDEESTTVTDKEQDQNSEGDQATIQQPQQQQQQQQQHAHQQPAQEVQSPKKLQKQQQTHQQHPGSQQNQHHQQKEDHKHHHHHQQQQQEDLKHQHQQQQQHQKQEKGYRPKTAPLRANGSKERHNSGNYIENQNQQQQQEKRATTASGLKRYGFSLTPEEQEIAYQLKVNMMKKIQKQNSSLENELAVRRSAQTVQRQQQQQRVYLTRAVPGNGLTQHNLKLLMKAYEKKAKDAEERINQLEQELSDSQSTAKRYQKMYLNEREKTSNKNTGDTSARSQTSNETGKSEHEKGMSKDGRKSEKKEKSTGTCKSAQGDRNKSLEQKSYSGSREKVSNDPEDDVSLYKRHIVKIVEKNAMKMTSPIRLQDIIRKNEVLIMENESLRREVDRLKWDNKQLVTQVKQSWSEKDKLLHEIGASEAARRDLSKRLEKEHKQNQILGKSLSQQASDWIQFRKEMHEMDNGKRLAMIGPISTSQKSSDERSFTHMTKRNDVKPRDIPVETWGDAKKCN